MYHVPEGWTLDTITDRKKLKEERTVIGRCESKEAK